MPHASGISAARSARYVYSQPHRGDGVALEEQVRQDGKGPSGDHPPVGEALWVAAGGDRASGGDIDFGGVEDAQPGAEFVKLVNNVPQE